MGNWLGKMVAGNRCAAVWRVADVHWQSRMGSKGGNSDLPHAQSPDTGRSVRARSWGANRDVDEGVLVGWLCC